MGTTVYNLVLEKRRTNIVFYFCKLCMEMVPANVTCNLAIVFLVFREIINILNKYCFHANNNLCVKKHIFV